jgi:hypothetical protein
MEREFPCHTSNSGMVIEPMGLRPQRGFYTCWVWVQVEIFTHGFAGMGPCEVAGWVRVCNSPVGTHWSPKNNVTSLNI